MRSLSILAAVVASLAIALTCTSCKTVKTAPDPASSTFTNPVPSITCGTRCPTSVGSVGP